MTATNPDQTAILIMNGTIDSGKSVKEKDTEGF